MAKRGQVNAGTAPGTGVGRLSWPVFMGLMAAASAIAVSVPFVPQPILEALTVEFGVDVAGAGIVPTASQLGAALGILLLVPLADTARPRRQLTVQFLLCGLALALGAMAPGISLLALCAGSAAAASVAAHIILPMTLRLAGEARRAHATATLGASLLFGIFGGRLVAGLMVAGVGWRWTLALYAILLVLGACIVVAAVPGHVRPPSSLSYPRLLAAVPVLGRQDPGLLLSAVVQGCLFAAFNGVWTVIGKHVTGLPSPWSPAQAGLVNLVGLGAAVAAVSVGRMVAGAGPHRTLRVTVPMMLAVSALLALAWSEIVLVLGVLLVLSVANQISHVSNQSLALAKHSEAAGRANTVYMALTMLGGAVGSAGGTQAFAWGGLQGTAVFALACVVLGTLMALARVRLLRR